MTSSLRSSAEHPSVVAAVRAEVDRWPAAVRESGLAGSALILAERLDEASARDSAALARELRATLADLQALAKAAPVEADPLAEIQDQVAAKRAEISKRAAAGRKPRRAGGQAGGRRGTGAGPKSG